MSYLVLARKYRPATFADIIGQAHVVRTLQNAITLGRVHHAFLFTGARGVGKTTTARVLARALNCEQGPTITPCGECSVCKQLASGASTDVIEIDGASNTGVDSIRDLRETVRYLPSQARFRLYIIDEVHMLSTAAFNALLKTLEEPPPHVKFIFATTEPHKIPVTILSRCQRFDFKKVSQEELVLHLAAVLRGEGVALGPAALAAIAREAQGSVRDALSLLDQVLSFCGAQPEDSEVLKALGLVERETIFHLIDATLAKDATKLLALIAEVDRLGHDLNDVATLLVEHCRDLLIAKLATGKEAMTDRSPSEREALFAQAQKLSIPDVHRLFRGLVEVAEDVSRSSFGRVTLEMGLLRLFELEPVARLDDLLARLDALVQGKAPRPSPTAKPPPDRTFAHLVERVRATKPAVASLLEHAHVVAFSPTKVELGFAAQTFYLEQAQDPEMRAIITSALAEHFGKKVGLKVVALDADAASATSTLAKTNDDSARRREEEVKTAAAAHPAVRQVISVLGGEITNVVALPRADDPTSKRR